MYTKMDLRSKHVLVMGLGQFGGGIGATRFLLSRGARVTVTDTSPADKLAKGLAQLHGLPVTFRLGEHVTSDFTSADLVVVNPAVNPHNNPYIQAAIQHNVPLTSEIRLLTANLPNRLRTIGITGSAGKSTTTAMIGHVLRKTLGESRVHVGGNIGGSLLNNLDTIAPDDWVVLELSSFMLEGLREDRWSPHIAVVTNFSPNHLDWHGDVASYQAAKQALLDFQRDDENDVAIFGPGIHNLFSHRVANMQFREMDDLGQNPAIPLLIPGIHNQMNATIAIDTLRAAAGIPAQQSIDALADFPGLTHRLQFVCERAGVRYFNDSKATTPEAAILAMQSFPRGVLHIILGGYDKKSDLAPMARFASQHCHAIYTIGTTGDAIANAARAESHGVADVHGPNQNISSCGGSDWSHDAAQIIPCGTLDKALEQTATRLRQNDIVLLSPGCASWDQFPNFEARGDAFAAAILNVTSEGAPHPPGR